MKLQCEKCNHKWDYKGANPFWVTCPRCRKIAKMPEAKNDLL